MPELRPTAEQLDRIAEQFWTAYLNPDGDRPLVTGLLDVQQTQLVASVTISGGWSGRLVLGCTRAGGRAVAAAMFLTSVEEVTDGDVRDAIGELANVLAGGVKGLLPGLSTLSLPQVGQPRRERQPTTLEVCRTAVRWQGQLYTVTLVQGRLAPTTRPVPA